VRGDIEILGRADALGLPREVPRARGGSTRAAAGPVLHELVLRHELQHTETMRQAWRSAACCRRRAAAARVGGATTSA
jgi:iron(II)-dependent oxidoreductase